MNLYRWLRVPWLRGGRDPSVGVDCLGGVLAVLREERGVQLPPAVVPGPGLGTQPSTALEAAFVRRATHPPYATWDVLVAPGAGGSRHAGVVVHHGSVLTWKDPCGAVCEPVSEFTRHGVLEVWRLRA